MDLAHWVRVESDVKMTPLPSPDRRPVVCGHRGAPTVQPENTLASFAAAEQRGATWVEFDVRPTGDGQLAIHHDPVTIDGIRLGSTGYRDLDSAIPRFGDLVAASPALGLDIEMKTDDIDMSLASFAELVVHEIGSHCSPSTELMVTSFDVAARVRTTFRTPLSPVLGSAPDEGPRFRPARLFGWTVLAFSGSNL